MVNKTYTEYLKNKINNLDTVSTPESDAMYIIEQNTGIEDFAILYISPKYFYIYKVSSESKAKKFLFCITDIIVSENYLFPLYKAISEENNSFFKRNDNGRISLSDGNIPDNILKFTNKLMESFPVIDGIAKLPLFISGNMEKMKSLQFQYALQCKYDASLNVLFPHEPCNTKGHIFIPAEIGEHNIEFSFGGLSVSSFFGAYDMRVAVPLQKDTLESPFWGKVQWNDIMPSNMVSYQMMGIRFCHISIRFYVDAYSNVFVSTMDSFGNGRVRHIFGKFGTVPVPRPQADGNAELSSPILEPLDPSIPESELLYVLVDTNEFISHPCIINEILRENPRNRVIVPDLVSNELEGVKNYNHQKLKRGNLTSDEDFDKCNTTIRSIRTATYVCSLYCVDKDQKNVFFPEYREEMLQRYFPDLNDKEEKSTDRKIQSMALWLRDQNKWKVCCLTNDFDWPQLLRPKMMMALTYQQFFNDKIDRLF